MSAHTLSVHADSKQVLLRPEEFAPTQPGLEVIGAFNPGAAVVVGRVLLLVRIVERPRPRAGFVGLPRWAGGGIEVDWLREDEVEFVDPRVVRLRATGRVRLTFTSHLRVVDMGQGLRVERFGASFLPSQPWEEYGVEDARITQLDGKFVITYVAVSRHGVATALACTADFTSFDRLGMIFPPENKDVVLFPERIGGQYAALHRPSGATPFTTPEMWLARSCDLLHWGGHEPLRFGRAAWESGRVGGGAPPLRTSEGWLCIYHGNQRPLQPGDVGAYHGAALLLDLEQPARVLRQSSIALLLPTEPFEREGFVKSVVFPTGVIERGDELLVYYGAGDTFTAVWRTTTRDILDSLRPTS